MKRRVWLTSLIAVSALARIGLAAGPPSASNSSIPAVIDLVARTGPDADGSGAFTVVVRDAANLPIPGARVEIQFACPQLEIGDPQRAPSVSLLSCAPPIVSAITDGSGTAAFVIEGAVGHRLAAEPPGPCATISASVGLGPAVVLGTASVAAFDQDGVNGVRAGDLALLECDLLSARQRSDFDGNGTVGPTDLNRMIAVLLGEASEVSEGHCDGGATLIEHIATDGDLRLAWNDCGGVATRTYACLSNSGTERLVASVVAPSGVTSLIGFEAVVDVVGASGSPLPEWWQFQPAGCRVGAISAGASPPPSCAALDGGAATTTVTVVADQPGGAGSDRERLRVVGVTGGSFALTPGQEYALFTVDIDHRKTVLLNPCAGCAAPVALVLRSLRFSQGACDLPAAAGAPPAGLARASSQPDDVLLTRASSASANTAYWQGVPPGFVVTGAGGEVPTALALAPPAPNPHRTSTMVRFGLPHETRVTLAVFDAAGRRLTTLAEGMLPAGEHAVEWNGRDAAGRAAPIGVYLVELQAEGRVLTQRAVRIR